MDADFQLLMEAFDVECKKVDYMKDASIPVAPPPAAGKRSYPSSSSTERGRGGSAKRGRK